jgi:lysophospholipase L1-like esterase
VKTWVLDHKPELVMIGGISNRGDVDSIREVIRQIRTTGDAEILVMTGPFGRYDPRKDEDFTLEIDPQGQSYESRLKRMAAEEKAEFVDVKGPWAQYIRTCGRDLEEFKRDVVHANAKGEAILGRILERYFRPK